MPTLFASTLPKVPANAQTKASLLKEADDKPTIGILLCQEKNYLEAEFALRDIKNQ